MIQKAYTLQVDINGKISYPLMEFTQNDTANYLYFNVTSGNNLIDLSTITSSITFEKPDGTKVVGSCYVENNQLAYKLGTQEIAVSGTVIATIEVYEGLNKLTSPRFQFNVQSQLDDGTGIVSTTEYSVLATLIADVQGINAVEALRVQAETQRKTNEDIRINNEGDATKGRIKAENDRVAAENIRKDAETLRSTTFTENETARANTFNASEASRASTFNTNEATRQAQETSRENAEALRVSTFNANETNRANTFTTNEAARNNTFNANEATRQANETARINAEGDATKGRVKAENDRVAAEGLRVNTFNANEIARANTFNNNEVTRQSQEVTRQNNEALRVQKLQRITEDNILKGSYPTPTNLTTTVDESGRITKRTYTQNGLITEINLRSNFDANNNPQSLTRELFDSSQKGISKMIHTLTYSALNEVTSDTVVQDAYDSVDIVVSRAGLAFSPLNSYSVTSLPTVANNTIVSDGSHYTVNLQNNISALEIHDSKILTTFSTPTAGTITI